jgi:hypothetical protein
MAAGVTLQDMRPWGRGALTIPPTSRSAWIQLAIWEIWMGMLVCLTLGLGLYLIATSPNRIVAVVDLTNCYAPPPVALPCERMVYRGGVLDAAFTALCGVMLIGVALWFLWELWSAVEDWRNPLTWPWARLFWAYGFTVVGVTLTAGVGLMLWMFVAPSAATLTPTGKVETSQSYTLSK